MRRVHPNAARQRGNAARSQNRAATDGQAVEFVRMFADGNHSVSARNRAREAPPPAAAIKVAYSNRVSPWTLRPRHRRPMKVRDTLRSNCDAQRAAPLRPSLANPCALKNASKFCPGVVADSAVLTAAGLCAAQHCKYLKEAPRRESRGLPREGALREPRHNQREGFQGGLPEPPSWRLQAVRVGATARCGARDCGLMMKNLRAHPAPVPTGQPLIPRRGAL